MNARSFVLVSVALGSAACGGEGSHDGAMTETPGLAVAPLVADARFDGAYAVPVEDPELRAFASNAVRVDVRSLGANRFRMKYDLPRFLVGGDEEVDLVGTREGSGPWTMEGPAGTATCQEDAPGQVRCDEVLGGVTVDLAKVELALTAAGIEGEERARRIQVAQRFSVDPLGVLTYARDERNGRRSY
jgi:hypothetical protein